MKHISIIASLFLLTTASCGESNSDGKKDGAAPTSNKTSVDANDNGTADDPVTQDFPTPTSTDSASKNGKKPGNTGSGNNQPTSDNSKTGASNCNAIFEDGYWKTWPKEGTKPTLPPTGPAPEGQCKATTSSDTTGGSTNGKSAGSQRVLMKTADGCYVPNGGGPVGPLLGACTGKTWRVPY